MKKIIITLMLMVSTIYATQKITPSEVYSEVMKIQQEINLIARHFNKNVNVSFKPVNSELKPRHAWQKTYEIFVKLNILRVTNDMPIIEPSYLEPVLHLDPILTYEHTQRILAEIAIFKFRMGIKEKIKSHKKYSNKTPLNVFNALNKVSKSIDIINGREFTPSYVFGETMRIFDDITTILEHLNINNETIPTKRRENAQPIDTFNVSMKILERIKVLQQSVAIEGVDFSDFRQKNITPSDVFGMTQMILAELQTIKAYVGLKGYVTSPAKSYTDKTPSDVDQIMGWSLRQISLIKTLNNLGEK